MPTLLGVVPNEQWQLVLAFAGEGHRLFDASTARADKGWNEFAYPDRFKNLTFDEHEVRWPGGRVLDAAYLHARSRPIDPASLPHQVLRMGYQNQAPTPAHPSHHVYGVYLYPFRQRPFEVGESIGGGHGEMGGSASHDLQSLRAWPGWKQDFELAGCGWAIVPIEQACDEQVLLRELIRRICEREGAPRA